MNKEMASENQEYVTVITHSPGEIPPSFKDEGPVELIDIDPNHFYKKVEWLARKNVVPTEEIPQTPDEFVKAVVNSELVDIDPPKTLSETCLDTAAKIEAVKTEAEKMPEKVKEFADGLEDSVCALPLFELTSQEQKQLKKSGLYFGPAAKEPSLPKVDLVDSKNLISTKKLAGGILAAEILTSLASCSPINTTPTETIAPTSSPMVEVFTPTPTSVPAMTSELNATPIPIIQTTDVPIRNNMDISITPTKLSLSEISKYPIFNDNREALNYLASEKGAKWLPGKFSDLIDKFPEESKGMWNLFINLKSAGNEFRDILLVPNPDSEEVTPVGVERMKGYMYIDFIDSNGKASIIRVNEPPNYEILQGRYYSENNYLKSFVFAGPSIGYPNGDCKSWGPRPVSDTGGVLEGFACSTDGTSRFYYYFSH